MSTRHPNPRNANPLDVLRFHVTETRGYNPWYALPNSGASQKSYSA